MLFIQSGFSIKRGQRLREVKKGSSLKDLKSCSLKELKSYLLKHLKSSSLKELKSSPLELKHFFTTKTELAKN